MHQYYLLDFNSCMECRVRREN